MAESTHIEGNSKNKARLTRSNDYRKKGYDYIKDNGGRQDAYGDVEAIQNVLDRMSAGSKVPAQSYTFTYKKNFAKGSYPYSNQGHHMLPVEVFSDKSIFTSDQLRMLRGVPDYDVNAGENVIFLPSRARDTCFHSLPYHRGPHHQYSEVVKTDMKDLSASLDSAIDADKEHKTWNPPGDIKTKLMQLQEDYWKYLTKCGPIAINDFHKPAAKKGIQKRKEN